MLRIVRVQSKREIDAVRRLIAFSGGAVATAFDRYSEPRGTMLLAYLDGIPVGCAALRPLTLVDGDQAIGQFDHLTVSPAGQRPGAAGGGIGRALLLFLIDEARVRGYGRVRAVLAPGDDAAAGLLRRQGFDAVPDRDGDMATLVFEHDLLAGPRPSAEPGETSSCLVDGYRRFCEVIAAFAPAMA
jgi:GNAT superfamily N-acetyltransferase